MAKMSRHKIRHLNNKAIVDAAVDWYLIQNQTFVSDSRRRLAEVELYNAVQDKRLG